MCQLRLPIDYPRILTAIPNYQQELFEISTSQYQKLDNSLEHFLLATWGCLIYRYHQDDTLINVYCNSCQSRYNHQLSFDVLSLQLPIIPSKTFAELLCNLEIQLTENKGIEEEKKSNVAFINSDLINLELFLNQFDFDLILSVNLSNNLEKDTYQCQLIYNANLFNSQTIKRIIEHFNILLDSLINNFQQPINQLPLLTESEKHKVLYEWNQTEIKYSQDKCIHQLFEEQTKKNPDAIAVIFENEQLTYKELNQKANQLAGYLQRLGISDGEFIGLFLEPSLNRIIGLLAILKVGGVYLPLDPNYPQDRLRFMVEDSKTSILLTQEYLNSKLSIQSLKIINLDRDWNTIEQQPYYKVENQTTVENLAYVIYTSGSTGRPKGVLIDHHALSFHCQNMIAYYHLNNSDRVLQFASFSFDVSLEQILPTLAVGATLILVDAKSLTPSDLNKTIIDFSLTIVNFPPVYLTQWLQYLEENKNHVTIDKLRLVISGGESLPLNTVQKWHQSPLQKVSLINAYGPTEATITAITFLVPKDNKLIELYRNIPIGRPLPNRKTYILDAQNNPVPIGIVGELYIGGEGLSSGYLNQLELTKQKFINNPFGLGKLYKTGDLARYLIDGNIEFLGRIDNQVKLRGFRIELGEIETILMQHSYVREAKLMIREDSYHNQRLVGYIILKSYQISSLEISNQIREYLKEKLPNYMIPSALIILEDFPLTPNGKIDYNSFPEPNFSTLQNSYIEPRTSTEKILANIWRQVLNIKNIGINNNFFELGGNSLLATQVISRVSKNLNREIPINLLFEYSTIAQLSEHIALKETSNNDLLISPIQPRKEQEFIPLSFTQKRLWFLNQLEPNNTAYNLCYRFHIEGLLNFDAFQKSLSKIRERHEILRTNFVSVNGKTVQIVNNSNNNLPIIDLRKFSDEDIKIEVEKIVKKEENYHFDLSTDSLFRVKLIQLNSQEYQLLFNIHHIIFDGWSFGLLFSELKSLYNSYCQDLNISLPSLPIQYADFTIWQKNYLKDEVLETQLNYWKKQLGRTLPILELPTDKPRPKIQTYKGATKIFILSSELTASIKEFSKKEGVTLFMTLLAAFKVLISRYSQQKDIIVGTAIAGRKRQELENLMGFFVNTLPLRSYLSEDFSFQELLTQIKQVCSDAYAYQDVPFEQLVEISQPERDLSHSPLFQVMFVLQNTAMDELELPNLTVTNLETSRQTAKFDLTLSMEKRQDKLIGEWEYNTDLFNDLTIERMSEHFQVLLSSILINPQENIWKLPLLTEIEKQQILVKWNQTQSHYPKDQCIHQLFEQQVTKNPDSVALIFEKQKLTYKELNQLSNQLANYLKKLKVSSQQIVGLCLEPSLVRIIALLAIFKVGAVYLPLDPAYPQERLNFIIKDSNVSLILTQEYLISQLSIDFLPIIDLDSAWKTISQESNHNLNIEINFKHLAYIIYTSGSTGKPKGVLVSHQGLSNLATAQTKLFQVQSSSQILQFSSLSFDASIWEIVMAFGSGACLYLGTFESLLPGKNLLNFLQEKKITHITLVPSVLANLPHANLPELKVVIVAGEPCRGDLAKIWSVGRQFFNAYGPTESTVCATVFNCQSMDFNHNPPIGRPIANTQIYILDNNLQLLPIGVPGELHIGGVGLAYGYLNREDLTKKQFIPNPFAEGKLYKTGDLAYYLPDGNIQLLGRIDNQVKIRGFRIELGEIEALLNQHDYVIEAKVITREDRYRNKQLVAYIILTSNQNFAKEVYLEIREYLKQQLPNYMIPTAFVVLDAFPLTPNGKIDYRALPKPDFSTIQSNYIAPKTPIEVIIANIWKEVLSLKYIGTNDNFFELGGHSLLATQVISRIREHFALEIPLSLLFEYPTIRQLSQHIALKDTSNNSLLIQPIQPRKKQNYIPLSSGQEGIWYLTQLKPNSTAYNMPFILKIQGLLDIFALENSINEIIKRHEILRTNFLLLDGQPTQIINQDINFKLSILNLRDLHTSDKEKEAKKIAYQMAKRSFDLAKDILFSIQLLQLDSEVYWLLFNIHHIIFDGWSYKILQRELFTLYQAYSQKKSSPLSSLPIQYADFSLWQHHCLIDKNLASQLSYWKQQLKGTLPILQLPIDFPRPSIQTYQSASYSWNLSSELTLKIKSFCQQERVTSFMTLLAAFKVLLYRYSGQKDIIVGTPIAGRNRREIENLMGFFVNTLPLRTDLSENPSFRELLLRIKQVTLKAFANQDLPFEKLVKEIKPERNVSHNPIFQVWFNMINLPADILQCEDLIIETLSIVEKTSKFDLSLYIEEDKDEINLEFVYNKCLFNTDTIEWMGRHFNQLLEGALTEPEKKISNFSLLTESDRLEFLNNKHIISPANSFVKFTKIEIEQSITARFEQQVKKYPTNIAIKSSTFQWSYLTLNEKSNQIAVNLIKECGQKKQRIALLFEHDAPMIAAILGVLKSGKIYIPLDPTYPQERISYILEDSQATAILTNSKNQFFANKLNKSNLKIINTENCQLDISLEIKNNLVSAKDLAYILYTSGSTGKPKGVVQNHRNVLYFIRNYTNNLHLSCSDKLIGLASYSFDAAIMDIWGALLNGATLCLYDLKTKGLMNLKNWLQTEKITIYHSTPTVYRYLLTTLENQTRENLFPDIRLVVLGGEEVVQKDVKLYQKYFADNCLFVNGLGPTESTLALQYFTNKKSIITKNTVSVGYPIEDTEILLLDEAENNNQIYGEIAIKSPHVALGYWQKPELTKKVFLSNSEDRNVTIYRTGDLGRLKTDGTIEFLGRKDFQVKIRGIRIELGEIENTLEQHPSINETVVIALENIEGDKKLIAYIVPYDISLIDNSQSFIKNQLRNFLKQKLPHYMIPSYFILLSNLPLTPSGKIDRLSLPKIDPNQLQVTANVVPPCNELELKLSKIWEKILNINLINVNDNFFDLGGHSLLAIRLLAEIEEKFSINISLSTFFQNPTITALVNLINEPKSIGIESSVVPIQTEGNKIPLFFVNSVSYAQKFASYLEKDQPFYILNIFGITDFLYPKLDSLAIEDIAEKFVEDIEKACPNSFYYLMTYCGDFSLTLEVIKQLQKKGKKIPKVFLIDSFLQPKNLGVYLHWYNLNHFGFSYLLEKVTSKLLFQKEQLIIFLKQILYKISFANKQSLYRYMKDIQLLQVLILARSKYYPQPSQVKVILFLSQEYRLLHTSNLPKFFEDNIEVHEIPGYHHTLFEDPYIQILATKLNSYLEAYPSDK